MLNMDIAGLLNKILFSVENIDLGRKCLTTDGREHEGRLFYEDGISAASASFQEASNRGFATSADPQTIILTEYTFLEQELQFSNEADTDTRSSLSQAIQSFDDDAGRISARSILPIGKTERSDVCPTFP
jgi:hypothetical protein